ncbi:TPA: hypothetical protein ACKRXF_004749, partial [Pseudomonas aeruginosa]
KGRSTPGMPGRPKSTPLRGKPFRRAVARSRQPPDNKKGRQAMLNEQPKRWRQASLIVFATTVILILPNLNSLIR